MTISFNGFGIYLFKQYGVSNAYVYVEIAMQNFQQKLWLNLQSYITWFVNIMNTNGSNRYTKRQRDNREQMIRQSTRSSVQLNIQITHNWVNFVAK